MSCAYYIRIFTPIVHFLNCCLACRSVEFSFCLLVNCFKIVYELQFVWFLHPRATLIVGHGICFPGSIITFHSAVLTFLIFCLIQMEKMRNQVSLLQSREKNWNCPCCKERVFSSMSSFLIFSHCCYESSSF